MKVQRSYVAALLLFLVTGIEGARASGFELKYWYADWTDGYDSDLDPKTGMLGFEWNGSGEKYFGGLSFMGGLYDFNYGEGESTEIRRLDGDLKFGRWLSKPSVGIFAGFRMIGFKASDNIALFSDYYTDSGENDWEYLRGPILGVAGELRASDYFYLGEGADHDYGFYYGASYSPYFEVDVSGGELEEGQDTDGKSWSVEAGLWYEATQYKLRLGYRHQEVTDVGYADEEFSGFVVALSFQ